MKKIILSAGFLSLLFSAQLVSAESLWRDITPSSAAASTAASSTTSSHLKNKSAFKNATSDNKLTHFRGLSLNESLMKARLQMTVTAPQAGSVNASQSTRNQARSSSQNPAKPVITIPLPDGETVSIQLEENHVMSPELAAKHPEIKTWDARGVDDPRISGVVDMTSYGFHAMLSLPDGDTVFVERANKDSSALYNSFSRRDNRDSFVQPFKCLLHDNPLSNHLATSHQMEKMAARRALSKITYRLAVAATGEYTQYHGGVNNALSAIVSTINRVNEVNERDLSIRFQLIPNEDRIIYTNPDTDPYTNNDAEAMIDENIVNLRFTLGSSQYDIGHVFTQGNPSGLALLGSACDDQTVIGAKAGGVTGSPSPNGDAFDLDFVTHELGHQIGGKHTFNSTTLSCGGGNRTPDSAVEPGSGSTIMAYAGICGKNDLQKHSDDYYHTKSVQEILEYTRNNSIGRSCGSHFSVSNNDPVPDAKQDTVIPALTPFILKGSASDPDGDALGYVWDQMDTGTASDVDVDTGDNALIRSWPPSSSPVRYVPRLIDLFSGRRVRGEHLPEGTRLLNFDFTVRDGFGGIEADELLIRVSGTGRPFELTSHGVSRNLGVRQQTRVSWDVAGTRSSPINCDSVNIDLLQSSGQSIRLKSDTSNDGVETVTIPDNAFGLSKVRMMVSCRRPASTFFNISSADLRIVAEGQGEADSTNNNGGGSGGGSGGGGSEDSGGGGGSLNILFLLTLMLLLIAQRRYKNSLVLRKNGEMI